VTSGEQYNTPTHAIVHALAQAVYRYQHTQKPQPKKRSAMADDQGDSLEISASHQALTVVAGWLGMSAEEALDETGAAADELFDKPRPNL
jgi:hypothetical protein